MPNNEAINDNVKNNNIKLLSDVVNEYSEFYLNTAEKLYNDIEAGDEFFNKSETECAELCKAALKGIYSRIKKNFDEEKIEKEILNLKVKARSYQLYDTNIADVIEEEIKEIVNINCKEQVLSDICGYTSKEDTINSTVSFIKDNVKALKIRMLYIERLMSNNTLTEQWERDITKALNAVKDIIKTVAVSFTINGITAKGKINTDALLYYIDRRSTVIKYNFCSFEEGEKIFKKLNLKSEDKISTNDISKVTYESMVLFKR